MAILCLYFLNVLPFLYFIAIAFFLFVLDFIFALLTLGKGVKKRILGTFLSFLKFGLLCFFLFHSIHTLLFLHKMNQGNYNTVNYQILVLKDSPYTSIKELKDKKIGSLEAKDDEELIQAKMQLNKKVSLEYKEADNLEDLSLLLKNHEVEAILIEEAQLSLLEEENNLFSQEKVLYSFSVNIEIKDELVKNVDITKEPFNVFISGIDTYGKVTSVSRSDVNMLISINPTTHKVLFISIPRDYYVPLNGIATKLKDKITHAGIHGINTSVKTVEDLLSIDINYYAKVNFTSLISIVDELDGIDVTLDQAFTAYYEEKNETIHYTFKKGENHLNGKQALAFARERKSLAQGDVERVKHQQMILEAIMNKVLSKKIITKYNDLLKDLDGKVITNLGTENITKLVKQQIKNMPSWSIDKYTLEGENSHQYTYSYPSVKSYVMLPKEESVKKAKEMIQNLRDGV